MNFNFVTERIAVGQKIDSQEFADALTAAGITHVINLYCEAEPFWKGNALSFSNPQEDDGTPRDANRVRECVRYAFDVLRDGGKLYVHCQWGLRRAPSTVYVILRRFGFTRDDAIRLINSTRVRASTENWEHYIASVEAAL